MKAKIIEQCENNKQKRLAYNLQSNCFSLKKSLSINDNAKMLAIKFFNEKIISNYKNKKPRNVNKKIDDFLCVVSNLYFSSENKPMVVSLGNNNYSASSFPSRFLIDIVNILHKNEYINIKKGFRSKRKEESRLSRVWATSRLREELFNTENRVGGLQIIDRCNSIILRDGFDKKSIMFRKTRYTNKLEREITFINEVNRQFAFEYIGDKGESIRLTSDLHAVFNDGTFEHGGRLYTGKHGYQGLCREDRKSITINGNETVELDYSGLHPHLLYAKLGIQAEGDQYSMVHPDTALRPVLKNALLMLLNASSEKLMVQAGNYYLYKNFELYNLMKEKNISIKDTLIMFKSAHEPISHFFCTGQGVKMMNIDSEIAKNILLYFSNRNEPCLCIHDSFIVEKSKKDILKKVMENMYAEIVMRRINTEKKYHCSVKDC